MFRQYHEESFFCFLYSKAKVHSERLPIEMQCLINAKVSAALLPLLQWPIILVWIFWKKATVLSFNHVNHDIVEADNVVNNGRKLLNRMNFTQQYWITEKLERVFPVFNISTNSQFFNQPNRLLQFTNTEQFAFSIPVKVPDHVRFQIHIVESM